MMSVARALLLAALAMLLIGPAAMAQANRPSPGAAAAPAGDDEAQETADDPDDADVPPTPAQRQQQERNRAQPRRPPIPPPQAARPQPQQPGRAAAGNAFPALEDLSATRERPLFSSTRRPPEPVEEPEAPAQITEGGTMPFELVGVVIGDEVNAAIFRNTESKEETRVARGDKIGNWNLEEVTARAVVIGANGKRVRMRLFDEASAPGVHVGRAGGDSDQHDAATDEEQVDQDIAPSSSPQAKKATAQPKPPPSVRQEEMRRRANRSQRPNQRPRRNNNRE
jgi:general secretion pathway protein N